MKPLIDGDILLYEIGFSGEIKGEDGEQVILPFDRVIELFDKKIELICDDVEATEPPTIYLTGDKHLWKIYNRQNGSDIEPVPNFRHTIAVTKGYKSTRVKSKPYHFLNLAAYIISEYDVFMANGAEADDYMCIEQTHSENKMDLLGLTHYGDEGGTTICSRDKDLRMCVGFHYSWECGKQAALGPVYVSPNHMYGWLEERPDGKIIGYGDMFFYYQLLIGDSVDTIPGCFGIGAKKAFPWLRGMTSTREMYEFVRSVYQEKHPDNWLEYMQEQANLLWMVRDLTADGELVMFKPPPKEKSDG